MQAAIFLGLVAGIGIIYLRTGKTSDLDACDQPPTAAEIVEERVESSAAGGGGGGDGASSLAAEVPPGPVGMTHEEMRRRKVAVRCAIDGVVLSSIAAAIAALLWREEKWTLGVVLDKVYSVFPREADFLKRLFS